MEYVHSFIYSFEYETIIRLLLGFFLAGIIVYFILSGAYTFSNSLDHYTNTTLHLKVENFANTILAIENILNEHDINIKNNQKDLKHKNEHYKIKHK